MKIQMKSVVWSLALASGLWVAAPVAEAQSNEGERPKKEQADGERPKKEKRREGAGDRLEMLRERLGLSEEQVAKLKPIFAAEREEMMAVRKELGEDADREEVREAMREVHEKYRPKIHAVLTPEQLEKLEKMRERRERSGGEDKEKGGAAGGERKKPKNEAPE